ncbi:DUF6798 domain-containing protein [Planctomicrobium sp. SH668]|uniref:DUF6798 domain-containing protein n=1 Tax=Planctomicrobium sp. SH668 TaxID=3448126 RepID=UPI003F5B56D8
MVALPETPRRQTLVGQLAVPVADFLTWILLLSWSLGRVSIPAVNEPYYLGKGFHWWDPNWCATDFFLSSSSPHQVFYFTFCWLALYFPLPVVAAIGRAVGLLILAIGWNRLAFGVTGSRWAGLFAIPVFLMFQTLGSLSGEWIVGGIESKVPAYGFLFWGLGCWLTGRPFAAAIAAGIAVSLHPLVGLWGVIAGMGASFALRLSRKDRLTGPEQSERSLSPKELAAMTVLFMLAALPGLIPAFGVLHASSPKVELNANLIQVGQRLAHHLDPMTFSKGAIFNWVLMIAVWLLLLKNVQLKNVQSTRGKWWTRFVGIAIAIAVVGMLVGWGPRPLATMPFYELRVKVLKFYLFRLGDQLVPVALSLVLVQVAYQNMIASQQPVLARIRCGSLFLGAMFLAWVIPFADTNPSRMTPREYADWTVTCRWIHDNSAPTDLFYTADSGFAGKWFANRPEYVNFKEMPQDSDSIAIWNQRLWTIANWRGAVSEDRTVTDQELLKLREQTGIRYFVCRRFRGIQREPSFQNESFRVYDLNQISTESEL